MPNWEAIQLKARHLIEEAIRLLRSGISEAEVLAEATAHATKLHVSLRKNRLDKYKLLHELGAEVALALEADVRVVTVTEAMKEKTTAVRRLDQEMERAEEALAKISVVRKDTLPPPSEPTPPLSPPSGGAA
jgi:hypothetical protein